MSRLEYNLATIIQKINPKKEPAIELKNKYNEFLCILFSSEFKELIIFDIMLSHFSTSPTGSENHLSPLRFQTFNRKVF